jgi:hypothetical protein
LEGLVNLKSTAATLLLGAAIAGISCTATAAQGYGGAGIYGSAWVDFVVKHPKAFDSLMYQARLAKMPPDAVKSDLRRISRAGIKVIVGAQFFGSRDERGARNGAPPLREQAHYEGLFAPLLDDPELKVEFYAIEEENVPWGGHAELLSGLYRALKQKYPQQNFYQWYRPRRLPAPPIPGKEWPDLPADGWVIDQYALEGEKFEDYVGAIKSLGKAVHTVIWACPQWRVGDRKRSINTTWWDEKGWKVFYSQLAVASREDLPTTFFMFARSAAGQGTTPLYKSEDKCDARFLQRFLSDTVPVVNAKTRLPLRVPEKRPPWIPGGCG